jgi:hypothetical protein
MCPPAWQIASNSSYVYVKEAWKIVVSYGTPPAGYRARVAV